MLFFFTYEITSVHVCRELGPMLMTFPNLLIGQLLC